MKDREDRAKGFSFPLCLFCLLQKDFAELLRSKKMAEEELATETTENEEKNDGLVKKKSHSKKRYR